jgi:hypothetical protein
MDLAKFLRDENIALYRRLLSASTDETERRTVLKLLAKEMAELRDDHPQPVPGK